MGIEEEFKLEVAPLREEIKQFDNTLLLVLEDRFMVCAEIAELKAQYGLDNHDPSREKELIADAISKHPNLSPELITRLYSLIFTYSKRYMKEVRQELAH
ncbi:chorismate mutase [Candidatus Woesearchaeota archaeon]|nr:chorismate mutase [Candidatus Woesearchaeota archaeon]